MTRFRSILVPLALAILAAGLVTLLVRNASRETPAGQMKQIAEDPTAPSKPAVWKPTPDQQELLDQAARTAPDPLSDELVPVLAALPKEDRELVFFDKLESHFYLAARSWALRDGTVTGDPREVEMFLSILSNFPEKAAVPQSGRNAAPKDYAFIALQNAVLAGDPHRSRFPEFERLALSHIDTLHGDHALRLLYILDQHDGLSDVGKQMLDERTEKQWVRNMVSRYYSMQKNDFFRKD